MRNIGKTEQVIQELKISLEAGKTTILIGSNNTSDYQKRLETLGCSVLFEPIYNKKEGCEIYCEITGDHWYTAPKVTLIGHNLKLV